MENRVYAANYKTSATGRTRDWTPLTEEQLGSYASDGYLHLKKVFSPAEVSRGLAVVDSLAADPVTIENREDFYHGDQATFRIRNAVGVTPGLDEMLDNPGLVGPLMSLLDGNIQILGTEVLVRGVSKQTPEPWHTDGGQYLQRVHLTADSCSIQIKVQVFLTDTSVDNSGNFLLVPGSHLRIPATQDYMCYIEELNEPFRRGEIPDDSIIVRAEPGDVLIFPHSLWHGVMANTARPRKTFIFRYGQLWQRPFDYSLQPATVLDRMSPRLRRMFGDFGPNPHPTVFYKPDDQDAVMAVGVGRIE
jgi:hypothetical protein